MKILVSLLIGAFIISTSAFAQQITISGTVKDETAEQPLIGATVVVTEHNGTTTDEHGMYSLSVSPGSYSLQVSYIGFIKEVVEINAENKNLNFDFLLKVQGIDEIKVVADMATTRETPLAFSSLSGQTFVERQGVQDMPLVLNTTPGVFSQPAGGGWYSTPFTIRGFHERNITVMIDGIHINDMERGQVFWGDWHGVNTVMSRIQVQRGLGASKVAVTSIGGTVNMITEGVFPKSKFEYVQTIGSFGYLSEELSINTGKLKGDWGLILQGTLVKGDGWADQTFVDAGSYFGKVEKKWGKHYSTLSAIGSPQANGINVMRHSIPTYDKEFAAKLGVSDSIIEATTERGHRYNENWGEVDRFTISNGDTSHNFDIAHDRKNYYHKRQFSLKDFWTVNSKFAWSNILYLTMGDHAGRTFIAGTIPLDANGQRDYQSAYNKNISSIDTNYSGLDHKSTAIRRTDVNDHIQYGLLSTAYVNLNDHWSYTGGLDLRSYTADHYSIVYDLLGGDYYIDNADKNQTSPIKRNGDKMLESYTSYIKWAGMFNQVEYKKDRWTAFGTLNLVETGFRREDYFKRKDIVLDDTIFLQAVGTGDTLLYEENVYTNQSPEARYSITDWVWIPGFTVKGGCNFNINEYHNVFLNTGVVSTPPRLLNIFDATNKEIPDYENQTAFSLEGGYGFNQRKASAMVNAYSTWWKNKPLDALLTFTDSTGELHYFNLDGLDALHMGIEMEIRYRPTKNLTLQGIVGLGDWRWKSADTVKIYSTSGVYLTTVAYNARNIHVGNAAQQQFGIIARYEIIKNLWVSGDYIYFTKYFADFNPLTLSSSGVFQDSWQAPGYGLLNLHAGYEFKLLKQLNFKLMGHVLNSLNTKYVVGMVNGTASDATTARVYWGKERTYSVSVAIAY